MPVELLILDPLPLERLPDPNRLSPVPVLAIDSCPAVVESVPSVIELASIVIEAPEAALVPTVPVNVPCVTATAPALLLSESPPAPSKVP